MGGWMGGLTRGAGPPPVAAGWSQGGGVWTGSSATHPPTLVEKERGKGGLAGCGQRGAGGPGGAPQLDLHSRMVAISD